MIINKAFKFRIYPNETQKALLAQHFGSCRFVYNAFLRERIDFYAANKSGLTYADTSRMMTDMKKCPDREWLKNVNSQSLQQSLRRLDVAYNNFFNKRAKFPAFKSKHDKQSFLVPQHFEIDIEQGFLTIPKFTPIKTVFHRPIEGAMKSVNISMTKTGKYFAAILCEIEKEIKQKQSGGEIGIDLGLKSFVVTSAGEEIPAPKYLRDSQEKLALLQRRLSRKVKRGSNRNKARIKVARIHEKITNQRSDFLHKLSYRLVRENQSIFAEDLNVKGIMANHHLAKSVSDAGWGEFIRQIKYKSEWNGVHFGQIDRFFPSSKKCHACGWINQSLTLSDREWTCQGCGRVVDRDRNAAKNILQFGQVGRDAAEPSKRPGRGGAVMPLDELGSPRL
ncbi:MAG: RNA-guided endonuclease TnpB family protein [Veillonellales bacterium]|jgi:putative transposase